MRTGSNYPNEIRHEMKSIRTGEARVAPGHPNLPCRYLILTVSPRFCEKYKTAAETALFSCYSSVLEVRLFKLGFNRSALMNECKTVIFFLW
jgi:hypothetical protein